MFRVMCSTRPMRRNLELEATIVEKYAAVEVFLDECGRRKWAATESRAIGYGGDALVSDATGLSRPTIRAGRRELESGSVERARIRRPGAGRPSIEHTQPGIKEAREKLVDSLIRGDPQSPLRWTCKSRAKLTAALLKGGWKVSSTTVSRLLHELGYGLQSIRKSREGISHPDRNAQFEHINRQADEFLQRGEPVVSVDTKKKDKKKDKKKEVVGDFRNGGREWQPKGRPERSLVHDFPQDSAGKAIPYGIYDMARNEASVNIGRDHDTPAFAVASLRRWWNEMGRRRYPEASCTSPPMRRVATDTARVLGSMDCRSSLTRRVCVSTSATSRRARASGIRLSTDCSATSRTIGEASRYIPSRLLST